MISYILWHKCFPVCWPSIWPSSHSSTISFTLDTPNWVSMREVDTNVLSFNLTLGSTASAGHWKLCMTLLEVPPGGWPVFSLHGNFSLLDRKLYKNNHTLNVHRVVCLACMEMPHFRPFLPSDQVPKAVTFNTPAQTSTSIYWNMKLHECKGQWVYWLMGFGRGVVIKVVAGVGRKM